MRSLNPRTCAGAERIAEHVHFYRPSFAVCALIVIVGIASGCVGNPTGPSTLDGIWGADHIAMTVAGTTHLELDCAHGDIPRVLAIDARGQFDVTGTFTREHGGPIRVGEDPDIHPASYSGSVAGDQLTLTIRLTDTIQTIDTFSLTRGVSGRIVKCL
jgi:hypothetical protein